MTPTHIEWVVKQLLIIGTGIQYHRQRISRADATAGGIQRELADRNTHPADALIAEAENTFAIGDDNHFNVLFGGVLQHIVNMFTIGISDKQPTGTAVYIREMFTGFPDRWGIDHRHHFAEMFINQAVKQGLIGILNIAQIDMFLDIVFKFLKLPIGAGSLLFN